MAINSYAPDLTVNDVAYLAERLAKAPFTLSNSNRILDGSRGASLLDGGAAQDYPSGPVTLVITSTPGVGPTPWADSSRRA